MGEAGRPGPSELGIPLERSNYATVDLGRLSEAAAVLPSVLGQQAFATMTLGEYLPNERPDIDNRQQTLYFLKVTDRDNPEYQHAVQLAEHQGIKSDGEVMVVVKDDVNTPDERINGVAFLELGEERSEEAAANMHVMHPDEKGGLYHIGRNNTMSWVKYPAAPPDQTKQEGWMPFWHNNSVSRKHVSVGGTGKNFHFFPMTDHAGRTFLNAPTAELHNTSSSHSATQIKIDQPARVSSSAAAEQLVGADESKKDDKERHGAAKAAGAAIMRKLRGKKQPPDQYERKKQEPGFEYVRGMSMTIPLGAERRPEDLPDFLGQRRLADIIVGGANPEDTNEELPFQRLALLQIVDDHRHEFREVRSLMKRHDTNPTPFMLAAYSKDEQGEEQLQAVTYLKADQRRRLSDARVSPSNIIGRGDEANLQWIGYPRGDVEGINGTPFNSSVSRGHMRVMIYPTSILVQQLSRNSYTKINAPRNAEYIP